MLYSNLLDFPPQTPVWRQNTVKTLHVGAIFLQLKYYGEFIKAIICIFFLCSEVRLSVTAMAVICDPPAVLPLVALFLSEKSIYSSIL